MVGSLRVCSHEDSSMTITGEPECAKRPGTASQNQVQLRLTNYCYLGTLVHMSQEKAGTRIRPVVERVQTGVRMEKRMLKVLKAIAEQKDMTLGDLLEGIVLHAFEGKAPVLVRKR